MSDILTKVIIFEAEKKHYSKEERKKIKRALHKECNVIIKSFGDSFVEAINKINQ